MTIEEGRGAWSGNSQHVWDRVLGARSFPRGKEGVPANVPRILRLIQLFRPPCKTTHLSKMAQDPNARRIKRY